MDGLNKQEYREYYQPILQKYLQSRKQCFQCYTINKEVWVDVLYIFNNKRDFKSIKSLYLKHSAIIQSYYYLEQIFGYQNIQTEEEYEIEQRDVLYFAIQQHLMEMFKQKKELFTKMIEYCKNKEYTEQFFCEFYSKFLLQISDSVQVFGLQSFCESMKEKRSILDQVYFFARYKQII